MNSHMTGVMDKTETESSSRGTNSLPEIATYDFSDTFVSTSIHFHIMDTHRVLHIWIGGDEASLSQMSYGIPIPSSIPSSCALMGNEDASDASNSIVQRLAKKYNRPVLMRLCTASSDSSFLVWVERTLNQYLQRVVFNPTKTVLSV